MNKGTKEKGIVLGKWFSQNWSIVLVILIFTVFSVEVIDAWFMWDAWQYYDFWKSNYDVRGIMEKLQTSSWSIYDMYLARHASLGYTLWIVLFQLMKEGTEMVQIADIALAEISIYAYYQILRKLMGHRYSNRVLALASAPYAFSPFVLGIVGNLNLDSATMYFAVIFVACSLYNYTCLELVFAFCFCFTKEPAIIYYTTYILAKVVCGYLSEYSFNWWKLIKFGLGSVKNYISALPVIIWLLLYLLDPSGGWESGGAGRFGFNATRIFIRLKQIFIINFNWLLWSVFFVWILALCFKKLKADKETLIKLFPICVMGIAIMAFGCSYDTFTHLRYIVPIVPVIYLMASVAASYIKDKLFGAWNIILSVFLLTQSFYVIDPIMAKVFPSLFVGSGKIYSMHESGKADFGDSMVYNRQYMYLTETILAVLEDADYNGDMQIVLPDPAICSERNFLNDVCLWNVEEKRPNYYDESREIPENCVLIRPCQIATWNNATQFYYRNNRLLYIVPAWVDIDTDFVSQGTIIKQGKVEHKGYSIQYFVMDIEDRLRLNGNHYLISPKQDNGLVLCTDGLIIALGKEEEVLSTQLAMLAVENRYLLVFDEYQIAVEFSYDVDSDNEKIWVTVLDSFPESLEWVLTEKNGYYMICHGEYALTYDLEDNTIRLTERTGEDNQLWQMNKQ